MTYNKARVSYNRHYSAKESQEKTSNTTNLMIRFQNATHEEQKDNY